MHVGPSCCQSKVVSELLGAGNLAAFRNEIVVRFKGCLASRKAEFDTIWCTLRSEDWVF
jgi:hypothetical protein